MSGTIAKATILAELKRLKFDGKKTYTAHELKGVGEYLLARRLIRWIESLPDQEKPYCLVTISGGVAEVYHRDEGCEIDVFDFDDWNAGRDPRDLRRAKAIAKNLPPEVGAAFLEELE